MVRLYLFGEGQTEVTFADLVLKPHLANFKVYLTNCIQVSTGSGKHKPQRGGGQSFELAKRDIERKLKQEKGGDVFFTTMIDLYALYTDFPGLDAAKRINDPQDKVKALEDSFAQEIGDSRFIPYLQLHEFEALLFVDPTYFAKRYEKAEKGIRALREIADGYASPELINDGLHSAPSKRIIEHFPNYARNKLTFGLPVAQDIGLAAIRAKCPHFNDWLTRLERLAGSFA